MSQKKAKEVFDAVFIAMIGALRSGEKVHVRGFGTFYFRRYPPPYHIKKILGDKFDPTAFRTHVAFKPCEFLKFALGPTTDRKQIRRYGNKIKP